MRTVAIVLISAATSASLVGCFSTDELMGGSIAPATDSGTSLSHDEAGASATTSDAGAPVAACVLDAPFSTPVAVAELNGAGFQGAAKLTADELGVFFERTVATGDGGASHLRLFAATRANVSAPFGDVVELPAPDPSADYANPSPTADNLHLYFACNSASGLGRYDLWSVTRADPTAAYSADPEDLAPPLNTSAGDGQPAVLGNGLVLYFTSNRSSAAGYSDILRATRTSDTQPFVLDDPSTVAAVDTDVDEYGPTPSADDLTLYFASRRDDLGVTGSRKGQLRIWRTTRASASAPFGTPVPENELTTSDGDTYPSWISSDGCRLYLYVLSVDGTTSTILRADKPAR